jgi:hypothetical protein
MLEKKMRWHRSIGGELTLQLLIDNKWIAYHRSPYAQPDHQIGTKGFRTAQYLLSIGWSYVEHNN